MIESVRMKGGERMPEAQYEHEYRGVISRIGATLLIFLGMFAVSQVIYTEMLRLIGTDDMGSYLICTVPYAILYFASFTLPILFFKRFSKRIGMEPMRLRPRMTADAPLLIIGAIGVILVCAVINNLLIAPLVSSETGMEDLYLPTEYNEPYQIVMQFILMALVPGICEELLFRSVVLSNLMPYGKTGAVIASALLFGLMHQNPGQMFYATMAGVILALLYIYTGSIFCCMLTHVCNNAFGVFEETLIAHLAEKDLWIVSAIESGLILLSALSLLVALLIRRVRLIPQVDFRSGVFGKTLPDAEGYAPKPVPSQRKIRLFFAPTMILFLVITAIEMALILFVLMFGV